MKYEQVEAVPVQYQIVLKNFHGIGYPLIRFYESGAFQACDYEEMF